MAYGLFRKQVPAPVAAARPQKAPEPAVATAAAQEVTMMKQTSRFVASEKT
jgi:hypothetical protein